jgi:hypothetical protein
MDPIITTEIPLERINNRRIRFSRPNAGINDVEAMLEVYPKPDGIVVTAVEPYAIQAVCDSILPRKVVEYAALTQEEFDRYALKWR